MLKLIKVSVWSSFKHFKASMKTYLTTSQQHLSVCLLLNMKTSSVNFFWHWIQKALTWKEKNNNLFNNYSWYIFPHSCIIFAAQEYFCVKANDKTLKTMNLSDTHTNTNVYIKKKKKSATCITANFKMD